MPSLRDSGVTSALPGTGSAGLSCSAPTGLGFGFPLGRGQDCSRKLLIVNGLLVLTGLAENVVSNPGAEKAGAKI